MKAKIVVVSVISVLVFSACARPTFVACRDEAAADTGEFKYTQRQAAIGCERAVLKLAANFNKEKGAWELKRDIVTVEDMRKLLADRAKALDDLQRYDIESLRQHIDWFKGLRGGLEREEQATLWLLQRIQFVDTYNKFVELVGELPKEMLGKDAEYFFEYGSKNYSMRMIYPARDVTKIPFTARYLEEAKSQGKLRLVDSFTVMDSRLYGEKIPDFKDSNKFSWDKRERGWKILSYKIIANSDMPNDSIVHYIEVFRVDANTAQVENGNAALRGYLASGGNNVSVFVIDYDKAGQDGFGSPDAVKSVLQSVVTGRDLYDNEFIRKELLVVLHERPKSDKARPERRRPLDPPVYVAIVPMGQQVKLDIWEVKKEGWSVPVSYKGLYKNLEIVYGKPSKEDVKRLKAANDKNEKEELKKIEILAREFKLSGDTVVIEYWKPKSEYSQLNIKHAMAGAGPNATYTIQRKGLAKEEAEIEFFGEKIKQIDYFYGGAWSRIVDEDGDGLFEKRRQIANPTKSFSATPASNGGGHGDMY